MMKSETTPNAIYITATIYINLVPGATYDLEVLEKQAAPQSTRSIGKMNYKYHHDNFASFIFRIFPRITMLEIHNLQKEINRFIP
ncbi:hypothetical protein [Loigolactobacillus iwatensis]|uniref:hypothetical protein n=1 Tax=Loigolactobacillus iwatensis TaxID=1267156 RepID=UPI000F7DEF19|nr:hypothetical protein [Loigolactobacillus iwatensis]